MTNLRIGKKAEVGLEMRDNKNKKLERGGAEVCAEIRYRNAGQSRYLLVDVEDRRDGTYKISFVPDVAGKLMLSVTVSEQPIKVSINIRANFASLLKPLPLILQA